MFSRQILRWVGIAMIVAILGGLFGWFLFVSRKQQAVDSVTRGLGLNEPAPAFSGGAGSMHENIVSFFGSTLRSVASGTSTTTPAETTQTGPSAPRLWRISPVPGVGLTVFSITGATSTDILRYVERPSGNVFEVPITGGAPNRLTNTLIPRVYEASWVDLNTLIIRHAKEENGLAIQTFLAGIKTTASSTDISSLSGTYLDENIQGVVSYTNGKNQALFYLVSNDQGTFGITTDAAGKNPKRLWDSALRDWRFSRVANDMIMLWQKASEGIVGSAYTLSLKTGKSTLLVGNKSGLMALKHSTEDAFLYSTSLNGKTTLYAVVDGTERELPVVTFAEKCVWGLGLPLKVYCAVPRALPPVQLPDMWYRGEVSFNDRWFVIDPTKATADALLTPTEEGDTTFDVIDPTSDDKHIFFTDAQSGTLWVLTM